MFKQIAHDINDEERTNDVFIEENITFSDMFLSDHCLKGLIYCGYKIPSPIQLRALPLAKSGIDLIVQAKSGTGKTLVFSIAILEQFDKSIQHPQSLILAPTREIAVQIADVLTMISKSIPDFKACAFIGGLNIMDDRKKMNNCRCVVGSPGRILQLIQNKILNINHITIFVLDEADKLMESSFLSDINKINKLLCSRKQFISTSATIDDKLQKILTSYMKNPVHITPKKEIPVLLGIKQFVLELNKDENSLKEMNSKIEQLKNIFKTISFKQCLVFSNSQSRAESYSNLLKNEEWPIEVLMGSQNQIKRLEILKKFREFKCRILITTDLMSRGIDIENINLVINLDIPDTGPCYLHRIGRAGRYGSYGLAITFIYSENDMKKFQKILGNIGGNDFSVMKFPKSYQSDDLWNFNNYEKEKNKFEKIFGVEDSVGNKENEKDISILNENLMLLKISSMMVDKKKTKIDLDENFDIFDGYSGNAQDKICDENQKLNSNRSLSEIDDIFESYQYADKIIDNVKKPESPIFVNNNQIDSNDIIIEHEEESDESLDTASDVSEFGSSENVELVEIESSSDSEIMPNSFSNNSQILWKQLYNQQVQMIQNYVNFYRNLQKGVHS